MVDEPLDPRGESRTAPTASQSLGGASQAVRVGEVLGDRYEIRSRLGAGGMGEVWLATDLRLRIDVALKSVRADYLANEQLRELLRREVLAAREVQSPNVCRVFDLQVTEDMELVSMEYVAGRTLAEFLKERTPLPLREARDIAAQFLAGLEAVHDAGLVHRDFKPENVMITLVGRVVVMDLGLAARPELMDGGAAGTPAYMPPEQGRGGPVDARADVFAAGVVLAEMIAPAGIRDREKRITLWEGLRSDPPRIPEGPWTPVIRKALSREPGDRFGSARELSRELDGLTLRVEEGESIEPYPGLAAFTEENAERFFGREAEIEALLRKLGRARLLAIAGPSGAGKTSFVQAGLIPALPEGWGHLVVHPGERPFEALTRGLAEGRLDRGGGGQPRHPEGAVPGFSPEGPLGRAKGEILRRVAREGAPQDDGSLSGSSPIEALRRWREDHDQAVLVLDQFEELFTLNAPEAQAAFAELLGRLPLEADVHVLLCMRDDFLIRCREHEALSPALAELTLLVHPTGAALRRALVQPALSCGYRFEDEALVEAMLGQVEHERGALPLLAFAAAELWSKRDSERGLLTRAAYEAIGGVGGALAHHAEETLEKIGTENVSTVREIFRNLVTAEGTRAARDREELLSVFDTKRPGTAGPGPGRVLDTLVDARLLTSYEVQEPHRRGRSDSSGSATTLPLSTSPSEGGSTPVRRIEIVHESLLAAWPRLVRWQTQDADAAQLRDQLRQAARAWDERDRSADLLWTGSAYREFTLWRERYRGGLSATESEFTQAMRIHAERARRRRRIAGIAAIGVLATVAVTMAGLWRSSEDARQSAEDEARRAEASKLVALGQLELEDHPTAAVAYATRSLELADTAAARRMALEALQRGPTYRAITLEAWSVRYSVFSPDGQWLAVAGPVPTVRVLHESGSPPIELPGHDTGPGAPGIGFGPDSQTLVTVDLDHIRFWSLPSGELTKAEPRPVGRPGGLSPFRVRDGRILVASGKRGSEWLIEEWPADGGPRKPLDRVPTVVFDVDDDAERVAYAEGSDVFLRPLGRSGVKGRLIARHSGPVVDLGFHPNGEWLIVSGDARSALVSIPEGREIRADLPPWARLDARGVWLAGDAPDYRSRILSDLRGPPGSAPIALRAGEANLNDQVFHPSEPWLASADHSDLRLWHVEAPEVFTLPGPVSDVAFSSDGERLFRVAVGVHSVTEWSLQGGPGRQLTLPEDVTPHGPTKILLHPDGERALVTTRRGVLVMPLDGGPARELTGFGKRSPPLYCDPHIDSSGRLFVLAGFHGAREEKVIRVWDIETGEVVHRFGPLRGAEEGGFVGGICAAFTRDGNLLSTSKEGLRLWNLESGESRLLIEARWLRSGLYTSAEGQRILVAGAEEDPQGKFGLRPVFFWFDSANEGITPLAPEVIGLSAAFALDPTGSRLALGEEDGVVTIRSSRGGPGHLLFGHEGPVQWVFLSPDGRWVASVAADNTLRVRRMPEPTSDPLHLLPRGELLTKLRSTTNVRVVEDSESLTGYKTELGPFPGWETPPTW